MLHTTVNFKDGQLIKQILHEKTFTFKNKIIIYHKDML